jgi:putative MATE family efflux protein
MTHARRSFGPAPRLAHIAVPLAGELVLGLGVAVIGTVLAGRQSTAAGAAFSLALQVLATLFVLFRIIGAGTSVVVSQALGGARRDEADRASLASLGASTWIGGGCGLVAMLGAPLLLELLNAPPDVTPLAMPLVQLLGLAAVLDAWNATLSSVLRSHLHARQSLGVMAVTQAVHLAGALLLMPQMGLPGFAVALLVSRVLGLVMFLYLWRQLLNLRVRMGDLLRWQSETLRPVLHVGVPGAAENVAWRLAFTTSIAAAGTLGTAAIATHGYTMQIIHLLLLPAFAIGLSGEIVIGHLIGAGRLSEADLVVKAILKRSVAIAAGLALMAALAAEPLFALFTDDPQVRQAGTRLLWITVALEAGRAFNLVLVNALRATGDARYPVKAGTASFVLVLAGGSWLLGPWLGGGLTGIWLAYVADEWTRGLLMAWRWRNRRWLPYARQTRRRMRHKH